MPARGRPANTGRGRMRVDRAMGGNTSSDVVDILSELRSASLDIVRLDIESAKGGNDDARKRILSLVEDDIYRAKSGQASDILLALAKVREKGSKINEATWSRLVKSVVEMGGDV